MYESATDPLYQTTAVNAWDPGANTGYDMGGVESWGRSKFDQHIHFINGDLTWQINKLIEIKGGFSYKDNHFYYQNSPMREVDGYEILQFPYTRNEIRGLEIPWETFRQATVDYEYGNIRLRETSPDSSIDDLYYSEYVRKPKEGAAYIQTRLNMDDIIFNAGVRLDYFWPKDRYAPTYDNVNPGEVGNPAYYVWSKPKYKFSPRFGLSFPISATGAIRLSYGHFYQLPSYQKMYQNPVLPHYNHFSIIETSVGNPNLRPEKTIQYEIGLQQELFKGFSTEFTVFYKDIRDLLGIELLTLSNATSFRRYVNKEYGNSTGITFAINYRALDNTVVANLDYTYMKAKGTSSSAEALQAVSILAGPGLGAYTMSVRKINVLDWDQTHSLNGTVSIMPSPTWVISLLGQYGTGLPYTPSTLNPSIVVPGRWWDYADRKPERWRIDLKVGKKFVLLGQQLNAYINILNVFNHLDENYVNSVTGRAGPNAYVPEIGTLRERRIKELGLFTLDEANYNPAQYSRPRFIQFGLNLIF
jgi:outer membrane receptor protein involved in Fe transport